MIDRRSLLTAAASTLAASTFGLSALGLPLGASAAAAGLKLGKPQPFSFDALIKEMQARAAQPYAQQNSLPQSVLERINYAEHGKIKFNTDFALFSHGPGDYPVTFFHLGKYFRTPVHMYVLSAAGPNATAAEILYDPAYFAMPPDSPAHELRKGAGFAGFRLQESRTGDQQKLDWRTNDWVAFLGAWYFRAIGELAQYGLSARGVAIDVSSPGPFHMTNPSESWISGRQSTGPGSLVSEYQYMEVMGAMPSWSTSRRRNSCAWTSMTTAWSRCMTNL
jgi:periplasmic glucans biosynthesis protein